MHNKWGCWSQKVKGQCYLHQITGLEAEIQKLKDYLVILEDENKKLKQALAAHHFAELLKIKGTYLDGYSFLLPEMKEIRYTKVSEQQEGCAFKPETCAGTYWYKNHLKEGLKETLNQNMTQYNQLLSLCLQLQYFYKHYTPHIAYAQYFFKLMTIDNKHILLCSDITGFLKKLPYENQSKMYLFTSDTMTQIAPENYLAFQYEKGTLYIQQIHLEAAYRSFETILISGLEAFARSISTVLNHKRYLPIAQIQGQLGLEKYASRATLLKAYLSNNFTPQGKDYPDGTYLPYQIMLKKIE